MNIASMLKGISVFIWFILIGIVALVVVQAARKTPMKKGKTLIITFLVIAVVLTTVSSGLVFINPEERGVVISAVAPDGYRKRSSAAGTNLDHPICRECENLSDFTADLHHVNCSLMKVLCRVMTRSLPERWMGRRSTWMHRSFSRSTPPRWSRCTFNGRIDMLN